MKAVKGPFFDYPQVYLRDKENLMKILKCAQRRIHFIKR